MLATRVSPHFRIARLLVALLLVILGSARLVPGPEAAAAAVSHVAGYQGTVDGFRSWYGSYGMDGLGTAWCIDHGIRAPDPAFGYVPTPVEDRPASTRTALAWVFGRYGVAPDRVTSAALMLVAHDLMGARYPSGPIDVDRLSPSAMPGFGADAAAVIERARAIKADGIAHAHLVAPYSLSIEAAAPLAGTEGRATVRMVDGQGAPVAGVDVRASIVGAPLTGPTTATTGADGLATFAFTGGLGPYRIDVAADAPDLALQAFASSTRPAQRVVRAATVSVGAGVDLFGLGRGSLAILKRGDAAPFLPVTGARFEVFALVAGVETATFAGDAALVIGPDGGAGPVDLIEGRYVVRETTPPPGYEPAGPWTVDVAPGATIVLEVDEVARRSSLALRKVDAVTGTALAGAVLAVQHDPEGDGTYQTPAAEITTTLDPVVVDDLVPGHYRVVEVAAPSGYVLADTPVDVVLDAATTLDVAMANHPVPTTTTTTTTAPLETTTTVSSVPETTTTTATPAVPPALPHTGVDPVGLTATGAGAILLGTSLLPPRSRPEPGPHRGGPRWRFRSP